MRRPYTGKVRSGDGPLSVRARPSSLKHDCDRRTTSTGRMYQVNVHAKSCLTLETSAAREYWENTQAAAHAAGQPRPEVKLPVGFTTFSGEIWRAPRSWAEKSYPSLTYFNEVDRGGHFAAWEEPELFATEIRAAFKPLRLQRLVPPT